MKATSYNYYHSIITCLALALCGVISNIASAESSGQNNPNIVFILADDMGYGDPGCYNGNSQIPTPNLDKLAEEGIRFSNAHASGSWCTPSRYGLLTGRYPCRIDVRQWNRQALIERGRVTLGSLLQRHGYYTACIGKWHLGFDNIQQADFTEPLTGGPVDVGFDTFFGLEASLDIPPYYYIKDDHVVKPPTIQCEDHYSPESSGWNRIQGAFWRGGNKAPGFDHEQVLPTLTDKAVAFLREHHAKRHEQPFFLYFPLTAPHTPWLPTAEFHGTSGAGIYGDFVHMADASVGRILKTLDKLEVADNTLVVFTSDNGPVWYKWNNIRFNHDSRGGLRGMKGDGWEGGHHVPFIARWPGHIPAGSRNNQLIGFTDLLATFANIVDAELPTDAGEDSLSILPLLLGNQPDKPIRQTLIIGNNTLIDWPWKYIDGSPMGGQHRVGLKWKFGSEHIQPFKSISSALYNLEQDPMEKTNLVEQLPEKTRELQNKLNDIKSAL